MALQKLTIPSANGSGIGFCFWQSPSVCVILPQQGGRLQVLSWFINAITHSSSMFFYHHTPTQNLVLGDILSNCSQSSHPVPDGWPNRVFQPMATTGDPP